MRIIRLTTTDPEGIFDNTFDSSLIIKPQSQLALKSCVFETQLKQIEIDSSNNKLDFQVITGDTQTFTINNGSFDANTYETLFDDMMVEGNKVLTRTKPVNTGMEIFYGKGQDGRFTQQYFHGEYLTGNGGRGTFPPYPQGQAGLELTAGSIDFVRSGGGQEGFFKSNQATAGPIPFGDCFMYGDRYVSRGVSQVSFQVRKMDMTVGVEQGVFGFTTTNPNTFTTANPPTINDIEYGVVITNTTAADGTGGAAYEKVVSGVRTGTAANVSYYGNSNNNNDYIVGGISEGKAYIEIRQVIGGANSETEILSEDYSFPEKLYPIWVATTSGQRGGTNNDFIFTKLRWTTSPREKRVKPVNVADFVETDLGANPPTAPSRAIQECFMEFEGITLANFLGYTFARTPSTPGSVIRVNGGSFEVKADDLFRPTALSDAFIVELLNLQVNSYDGLKESRKPYLAVVPRSDADGSVIYDTTFPVFVDLDNADSLNLRNIKARLLNSDGSEVLIEGLSTLVILVKDKDESM